jgi:hypothetical protein
MSLVLKLTYFAVERAAEPVSNIIERQAMNSPSFRATCKRLAKWHSRIEYNKELRRIQAQQQMSELHPDPGHGNWVPSDDVQPPADLDEKDATRRGAEVCTR